MNGKMYVLNAHLHVPWSRLRLLDGEPVHHRGVLLVKEKVRRCESGSSLASSSLSSSVSDEHDEPASSCRYSGEAVRDGIGVAVAVEQTDVAGLSVPNG